MKLLLPFVLFFTQLGIPNVVRAGIPFLEMDLNQVREMAGEKGSLYFAFFTADWCAPCRWMEDQSFEAPRLIQYVTDHYLAVKVDIDHRVGRVHQERLQVTVLPSILIFNAQGQLLARIETALSGDELLRILQEHDLPKNRIGSKTKGYPATEKILDSPKPQISLYRPPLPTEEPADAAAGLMPPPPVVIPANVPDRPVKVPEFQPARATLAPRSERSFSIQVAAYSTYEQAVRQVAQLESGFKEPVQLRKASDADGQDIFRVFIGLFPDKKTAEDYLYYLRRKNMSGIIRDMQEER